MLVSSAYHSISITKKNGEYVVYDPNYPSGFKAFSDEKKLMKELHNKVFYYAGPLTQHLNRDLSPITGAMGLNGSLGMLVQVIRHPSQANTPRESPDVNALLGLKENTSPKYRQV